MTTTMEYALFAGTAYESTRKDPNKIPPPEGWNQLAGKLWHRQNDTSGFEAVAFIKDNTIVISYAGTYPDQWPDIQADIQLGKGTMHSQLIESAKYYQDIKKEYPESEGFRYTFTGHSLGGGLAALMGVFFNKPAVTFDPAPFRRSVTAENRKEISDALAANGYGKDVDLDTATTLLYPNGVPVFLWSERHVSSTAVAGEFLSIPLSELLRIRTGATNLIYHGNSNQGGLNEFGSDVLHAQTLLIALKQSVPLRTSTFVMPYLIPDLFDEKLFAVAAKKPERDLLTHLIRREFGVPSVPGVSDGATDTDLLTKFGQDMLALATSGTAGSDIRQSLERIAFAYYYSKTEGNAEVFFEALSGGLRFDLTGVALGNAQPAYDQLKTWIKNKAPSEASEKLNQLDTYKRLTLGLSASLTSTAPDDNQADFMLGGASGSTLDGKGGDDLLIGRDGNDTLKGGAGADSLYGGSGNDSLEGGEGDDTLEGGAGHDTYIWSAGDGNDTIKDSDGQGHIEIRQIDGSSQILGGQLIKQENGDTWKSTDGQLTLAKGQGWTLTTQNGATLIFDQYKDGDFGLTQKAAPEKDKPTPTTQIGDKKSDGAAAPNQRDILMGSYGSADQLEGRGGNDILDGDQKGEFALSDDRLKGEKGNDILWGNEGRDILEGGEGKDWLNGGPGDDKLYADKESKPEDILKQEGKGGTPGDWLDGDQGDDTLIGDLDDDLLMGGHGKDILIGGGGNDTLVGGGGTRIASFLMPGKRTLGNGQEEDILYPELEWTLKREIENGRTYKYTHDITKTTSFTALDFYKNGDDTQGDVLYGGGGEDWIYAGEGDDYAEGGDGDDAAFGEAGNDILNGGKGKDVLVGDDPDTGGKDDLPGARHGDDALAGGEGDDILFGNGGHDMLSGGAGDDTIAGDDGATPGQYHGHDTLDGGAGKDGLWGFGGDDVLLGGAGDDHLEGDYSILNTAYHGNDLIDGGEGNDELLGQGGDDTLNGGKGEDRLWGDGDNTSGDDRLDGGEGDDRLYGGEGHDALNGGDGKDFLKGDDDEAENAPGGDDILFGGAGDDELRGCAGNDGLDGGAGNDLLTGGYGGDFVVGGAGDDTLGGEFDPEDPNGGNDTLDGGDGNDWMSGHGGNDMLSGGAGDDLMTGDFGDDILDGGDGFNRMDGGEGNDILIGGSGRDLYFFNLEKPTGKDHIQDAGGEDVAVFVLDFKGRYGITPTSPDYWYFIMDYFSRNIKISIGSMLLDFGNGNALHIDDFDPENPYGSEGIEWFQFDQMVVSKRQMIDWLGFTLEGTEGNDLLVAPNARSRISTGGGDDRVVGGKGSDSIDLGEGRDWADGGSGKDYLSGGGGNDTLLGGEWRDYLYGGLGDDMLNGGEHDDILYGGEGNDTLEGGDDYGYDKLYGEEGNDTLNGGEGGDELEGGAGDDALEGGASNDYLSGGDGDDVLFGGLGDDRLEGGSGNDVIEYGWGDGFDRAWAGGGFDRVRLRGATQADITAHRDGDDLLLMTHGDGELRAKDWYVPDNGFVALELGDGSLLDRIAVEALVYSNLPSEPVEDEITITKGDLFGVFGNVLDNDLDDHSRPEPGIHLNPPRRVVTEFTSSDGLTHITFVHYEHIDYRSKLTVDEGGVFSGNHGFLKLEREGDFSYMLNNLDPEVIALMPGQTLTDTFTYMVNDNDPLGGMTSTSQLTVTIQGSNLVPIANPEMLFVVEDDVLMASGNVLMNDKDWDTAVLAVSNPGVYAGKYGALTLSGDGAYRYDLANDSLAVQSLGRTNENTPYGMGNGLEMVVETFHYDLTDGASTVSGVPIYVLVTGSNDAPIVNVPLADQTIEAGSGWSFTRPEQMFGDVDSRDALTFRYEITSPDSTPTDWIQEDPLTGALGGVAPTGVNGQIEISVVASDGMFGNESAQPPLSTTESFTLTLETPPLPPPDPARPDPIAEDMFPVGVVNLVTVDPVQPPPETLPGDNPGTPGESPPTMDAAPLADNPGGELAVASSNSSSSGVVANFAPMNYAPVMPVIVYSVYIHTPLMEAGGGSCDCQPETESIDPLLAGVAPDQVYGAGLILGGDSTANLLLGSTSDDQIAGIGGDDMLVGELGRDRLDGGDGDDQIAGDKGGQDESGDDDSINGGLGNDRIAGQGGNDTLAGGEGDDLIDGGEGHDLISGNQGADRLQGGAGSDWLQGNEDDDLLIGESGNDRLEGGDGKDALYGGSGEDTLLGGEGDDALIGGDCSDVIEGGIGNDQISGGTGHDRIDGGEGDDALFGDECNDTLSGSAGKDQLQGGNGQDQLDGGEGDDVLFGDEDSDQLSGGDGDDYLAGDNSTVKLTGDDRLDGGLGNDTLLGNAGMDALEGGEGDDKLQGGAGDDALSGGAGDDVYFFAAGDGKDHVADSSGTDWLVLEGLNFEDVEDFDETECKLVFKDGSEIYLDDLNPEVLMAEGGIEYIQFADKRVMSRQELIREFVPALGGMQEGMEKVVTPDNVNLKAFSDMQESNIKADGLSEAVQWFASAPDFQKQTQPFFSRSLLSSGQDNTAPERSGTEVMAQWQAMDAALAAHLAKGEGDAANDMGGGADLRGALNFLGSISPWARDPLSLAVSGGDVPKTFHGLNEGVGRISA